MGKQGPREHEVCIFFQDHIEPHVPTGDRERRLVRDKFAAILRNKTGRRTGIGGGRNGSSSSAVIFTAGGRGRWQPGRTDEAGDVRDALAGNAALGAEP